VASYLVKLGYNLTFTFNRKVAGSCNIRTYMIYLLQRMTINYKSSRILYRTILRTLKCYVHKMLQFCEIKGFTAGTSQCSGSLGRLPCCDKLSSATVKHAGCFMTAAVDCHPYPLPSPHHTADTDKYRLARSCREII
jgi:hypothetical protein